MYYLVQVVDVKKSIESAQGADVYPASQQMLIHQGKVLQDTTTLEENKVAENSFVVVMLSKVCFLHLLSICVTFLTNIERNKHCLLSCCPAYS